MFFTSINTVERHLEMFLLPFRVETFPRAECFYQLKHQVGAAQVTELRPQACGASQPFTSTYEACCYRYSATGSRRVYALYCGSLKVLEPLSGGTARSQ